MTRAGTALDLAAARAAVTPDRPALWWDGRWYTYAELDRRAERLAGRLHAEGVRRGDRVSILARNHLAHLDLILATAKLGFVYTPLNYRLGERELRELTEYARPRLLLFDQPSAPTAAGLGAPAAALADYDAWLGDPPAAPRPDLGPEDPQMILFTGGTTGLPKGAVLPYRQGLFNAAATVLSWGLREDDCVIQATPCFHAAVNALAVPLLHAGARVALAPSFEPAEYLRLVPELGVTLLFLVPTMYRMLAEDPGFATADLSRVRWAISGGAPCPAPVREAFVRRGVRFRQGYGLSEAGVNCFAIDLPDAEQRPSSVGRPLLFTEAAVRRPDGAIAAPGEVGELTLRGPHLFSGYFDRPEATSEVLRDGWLWTGDLATRDADGFFQLVGRRKEMFISGGENVFPAEVEDALYRHPAVAECAVLGVPDERWGEVGLAVVALRPGGAHGAAAEAALLAHLRRELARYKVPKHLRIVPELPKSGAGKILKAELREAFLAGRPAGGPAPADPPGGGS